MDDIITHNSRTDRDRILKLGDGIEHLTQCVVIGQDQKGHGSRSQDYVTHQH